MTLYMAVTADQFELPLVVEPKICDLADKLGRNMCSVVQELCRNRRGRSDTNGQRKGYVLKEIEVDGDD